VTFAEQSVSERGKPPVVAQSVKVETEREHQVQAPSSKEIQKTHEYVLSLII
jgi:hypothetical protein